MRKVILALILVPALAWSIEIGGGTKMDVGNSHRDDIALGAEGEDYNYNRFGANDTVGTTEEEIWSFSDTYNFLTSPMNLRIRAGGNAEDTEGGDGARAVYIEGLDENFNRIRNTIITSGTLVSAISTQTFIRVNRAFVTEVGSYGADNSGDIVIESTSGLAVAHLDTGFSQSLQTIYTIPAGFTCVLQSILVGVPATKSVNFRMYRRENADVTAGPFTPKRVVHVESGISNTRSNDHSGIATFKEKTDVWFTGFTGSGSSDAEVEYDLACYKD